MSEEKTERFWVPISITTDEAITRGELESKLFKALEHSTAREALSEATNCSISVGAFEPLEDEYRNALIDDARQSLDFTVLNSSEVAIDNDAVVSMAAPEAAWVQAWVRIELSDSYQVDTGTA